MNKRTQHVFEFGPFCLDVEERVLRREGKVVPLTPKSADMLLLLAENAGHVVEKEELLKRLWPDTFVEEGSLSKNVFLLRQALADEHGQYIETVARRGYRFVAQVKERTEPVETVVPEENTVSPVLIEPSAQIREPGSRAVVWWVVAAITALTMAGAAVWWRIKAMPKAAPHQIRSIAVLPLRNLSRDPDQEFFSDGTTEALISGLAQIHALRVISRTSVMRYKGTTKPVPEIGRELGVDAVVEGSVQRVGDRVRITAQLIQASTDTHLWANDYERDMANVLKLEAEVARAITQEIRIQLTSEERTRFASARSINPAAQEAYLLGRYHRWKLNEQDLRQAIEHFEQAARLQPDFAPAYAGLSTAWHERGVWGAMGFREVEEPARKAGLEALERDPNLSEAHAALAEGLSTYDWNWHEAEKEHQRALDLDSNNLEARVSYAVLLMALGRHPEAIAQMDRAAALDPLSSDVQSTFGRVLFRARKFEDAVPRFQRAIELDSQNYGAYTRLAELYEQTGKLKESLALVEQSLRIRGADVTKSAALGRIYALLGRRSEALKVIGRVTKPGSKPTGQDVALIYFALNDNDRGFQWLTKAFDQRQLVVYVKADPRFDSVRSDPRFEALVRRLGMPELPR